MPSNQALGRAPIRALGVKHQVVFDDFSGGEYGTLGGHTASPKTFTGSNVIRYFDGSLGPRMGLAALNVAGLPAGQLSLLARGSRADDALNAYVVIINNNVYGFADAGGASGLTAIPYTGSLAVTPSTPVACAFDSYGASYITVEGDKCYLLDHTAKTVTALAGSPGGRSICAYNGRLIVGTGGTGVLGRRLYYSDSGQASFPARNYVDVGDAKPITGLYPFRNRLYIAKQGGWYQMTGVVGSSDTFRQVLPAETEFVAHHFHASVTPGGTGMWFVPSGSDWPALFTGTNYKILRHLSLGTGWSTDVNQLPPALALTSLRYQDDAAIVGQNAALILRNGAWTKHSFDPVANSFTGVNVGGWAVTPQPGSTYGGTIASRLILSDGGSPLLAPKFYTLMVCEQERPAILGELHESLGDASDTPLLANFSTPEWWEPNGYQMLVRSVMIDFKKYSTGSTATNHFDVSVSALRRYAGTSATSGVKSFDEDPTGGTDGTETRWEHGFGDQGYSAGFQINLSNLRGVAIRRISVDAIVASKTTQ